MRCTEDANLCVYAYSCENHWCLGLFTIKESLFKKKNFQFPIYTAPYHQSHAHPVCIMTFQDPITLWHTDGQMA